MKRKILLITIITMLIISIWGLITCVNATNTDDFYTWNKIYDTWNVGGIQRGVPSRDNLITISKKTYIQGIVNYHWYNNGKTEGTIGIVNNSTGETIGTWNVIMTAGSGRTNVNWYAFPNIFLSAGTYKIVDSDNSTWSFNSSSSYKGFTDIRGYIPTVIIGEIQNGTITADKLDANENDTVTLTITPNADYRLKSITGVTTTKVNNTTYTFTMPSGDVTINAEFELIYTEETITKTEDNMTVFTKGTFSGTPTLVITKIENGNEGYNSLITLVKDDKEVIGSYDVTITGGTYKGELELTFTVGEQYDGDKITIYHKLANGEVETKTATVKNGKLAITVTELSPFMLVKDKEVELEKDNTPKTGTIVYINTVTIIIISITGIVLLKKKIKQKIIN